MKLNWFSIKIQLRDALATAQPVAVGAVRSGPVKCARLALAIVAGVLALACLPLLLAAALVIVAPVALVVVALGGLALASWPYALPKLPAPTP